MILQIKHQ